jgi:hypothetical protein
MTVQHRVGGWAAVSEAQGFVCVYHCWVEGRGWHNMTRRSVLCRYVLVALMRLSENRTPPLGAKRTAPPPSCQGRLRQEITTLAGDSCFSCLGALLLYIPTIIGCRYVHLASTLYYHA